MKTRFIRTITLLTISAFMMLSSFAVTSAIQTRDEAKKVVLAGSFNNAILRSFTEDFIATVDVHVINISYMKSYVDITIEITDETGQTVYCDIVDPVAGNYLIIDISNWEEGGYHISFTNASGGCIYGDFEIEH